MIADAMPPALGALEQTLDLAGIQEVLLPLMRIGCRGSLPWRMPTLPNSPFGGHL
jgi:hypothetical protein